MASISAARSRTSASSSAAALRASLVARLNSRRSRTLVSTTFACTLTKKLSQNQTVPGFVPMMYTLLHQETQPWDGQEERSNLLRRSGRSATRSGSASSRSSWRTHPRPPRAMAAGVASTGGRRSTASSSASAAAASGTDSPNTSATIARCTAGSSAGAGTESSRRSGRYWSRSATNSGRSTGNGRQPTRCWARPGSGGEKVGKNPTDRGKPGTKKSVLTDSDGGPLGVVIAGANVVDQQLLEATIEAIVVERPDPEEVEQHLSLDKGYDNPTGHEVTEEKGYIGHIRPIREDCREKRLPGRRKARRWVVERTLALLSTTAQNQSCLTVLR